MNKIESLQRYIQRKYPNATMNLAPPLNPGGIWSLDVDLADKKLAIEWSHATGFGVSSKSFETFGETADEQIKSLNATQKRIQELITTDQHTAPPLPVVLSRLREKRGLTQQELAERLGVRQASISGMERRGDIQISTLQRVVEALGGTLEICGSFSDSGERIVLASRSSYHVSPNLQHQRCSTHPPAFDEGSFENLCRTGLLPHATEVAAMICNRHSVIEML